MPAVCRSDRKELKRKAAIEICFEQRATIATLRGARSGFDEPMRIGHDQDKSERFMKNKFTA
jgi:hypothetical protein